MKTLTKVNLDAFIPDLSRWVRPTIILNRKKRSKLNRERLFLDHHRSQYHDIQAVGLTREHVLDWKSVRRRAVELETIANVLHKARLETLRNVFIEAFGELPKERWHNRDKRFVVIPSVDNIYVEVFDGFGLWSRRASDLIANAIADKAIKYYTFTDVQREAYYKLVSREKVMSIRARTYTNAWLNSLNLRIDEFVKATTEHYPGMDSHSSEQMFGEHTYLLLDDGVEEFIIHCDSRNNHKKIVLYDCRQK